MPARSSALPARTSNPATKGQYLPQAVTPRLSAPGSPPGPVPVRAWIAVPPGAAAQGYGTVVTLSVRGRKNVSVYGRPGGTSGNMIGSTPAGSAYLSPWRVWMSGKAWYAINYNHRQAWVPAAEVSSTRTS
jgi:hypothetical protein